MLRSLVQHDPHCSSCQAAAAAAAAVLERLRYPTVLLQQLLQGWALESAPAQPC
jgi:protein-disulfide isomerase